MHARQQPARTTEMRLKIVEVLQQYKKIFAARGKVG